VLRAADSVIKQGTEKVKFISTEIWSCQSRVSEGWSLLGCDGMPLGILGCDGMPLDILGCGGMPLDILGCGGMPLDIL